MKFEHIYHQEQFGENWFSYPTFYKVIVEKFSSGSHFVEIGSWKGKSAAFMAVEIANSGKQIKFDCIDTWKGSEEHLNPKSPVYNIHAVNDELYDIFLNNMKSLKQYFNAIRKTSKDASLLYKNNSLDFVFIDADHSYNGVLQDIQLWEPKIKKGGIISGHDYNTSWVGVTTAVNDYYKDKVRSFEGDCWYVLK